MIPRIEQLLRENAALKSGRDDNAEAFEEVEGLLVKNEYLTDQVTKLKMQLNSSYKSREERADMLMQIEQLRDEREDLL